jgi:hypothetical protein
MALLNVKSDNPTWVMDGLNLLEIIQRPHGPRGKPIPLSWAGQNGVIDEHLKIINKPSFGQCDSQAPYNETVGHASSTRCATFAHALCLTSVCMVGFGGLLFVRCCRGEQWLLARAPTHANTPHT